MCVFFFLNRLQVKNTWITDVTCRNQMLAGSLADALPKVSGYGTRVGCRKKALLILCASERKRDAGVSAAVGKIPF